MLVSQSQSPAGILIQAIGLHVYPVGHPLSSKLEHSFVKVGSFSRHHQLQALVS